MLLSALFTPWGAKKGLGFAKALMPCQVEVGVPTCATPVSPQEGFAPPEDDELEEQPPEDQDEY